MIELPEAVTLARQLDAAVQGRRIEEVVAAHTPHKFAWFHGDPGEYRDLLRGQTVRQATSHGGFVAIELDDTRLLFGEGVSLRLYAPDDPRPAKHQLLVDLEDGRFLVASVQMYGGLWAFREGAYENPYYAAATAVPSPLDDGFDAPYFMHLVGAPDVQTLSAKALLATEQRIPGLGNGVLQDILFEAGLHPRRKVLDLTPEQRDGLFGAVKSTLIEMTRLGGRDTERDLYGQTGGYRTKLSRNTVGQPCPRCGGTIQKAAYLGGSVYFCGNCQMK